MRETEEMMRQTEEDNDREVLTLKTSYERRLQDEKVALHVRFSPCIFQPRSQFVSISIVA